MAGALKLEDVFKIGKVEKNKDNIGKLCTCLLDTSSPKEHGWLYDHFNKNEVDANELYVNNRVLLASRTLVDSDLSLALSKSIVGSLSVPNFFNKSNLQKLLPPQGSVELIRFALP